METGVTDHGIVCGTGPYRAASQTTDTSLVLEKNDHYWNGEPKLDEITGRTISDGDTLTMALQSGEIDAAYGMPYASYPLFENDAYTFTSCATSRVFSGARIFATTIIQDPSLRQTSATGIAHVRFVATLPGVPGNVAAQDDTRNSRVARAASND